MEDLTISFLKTLITNNHKKKFIKCGIIPIDDNIIGLSDIESFVINLNSTRSYAICFHIDNKNIFINKSWNNKLEYFVSSESTPYIYGKFRNGKIKQIVPFNRDITLTIRIYKSIDMKNIYLIDDIGKTIN